MTTCEIIEDLYLSPEVDRCIMKLVRSCDQDDFKQELFVIIGTMKAEVVTALHSRNELKRYVARIIINLCRNKRNVYHKKYLDTRTTYDTDIINALNPPSDYDQMEQRIAAENKEIELCEAVENFDVRFNTPYFRMLAHVVADSGSMRAASRETGVPLTTIHRSIGEIRKHLSTI